MSRDVIIAIASVVFAFGLKAGVDWLRARGKSAVQRAEAALAKARLTPDERDDALAEMAYERAREDRETFDWWADKLDEVRTLPGTILMKKK